MHFVQAWLDKSSNCEERHVSGHQVHNPRYLNHFDISYEQSNISTRPELYIATSRSLEDKIYHLRLALPTLKTLEIPYHDNQPIEDINFS